MDQRFAPVNFVFLVFGNMKNKGSFQKELDKIDTVVLIITL